MWHIHCAPVPQMLGATNPLESEPGTIRGDFCLEVGRNICHGSDSVENAEREIGLWFKEGEVRGGARSAEGGGAIFTMSCRDP